MPGRAASAVAITVVGVLFAIPPLPHHANIRLTSVDDADSPLGDGTALIFGTSGTPVASPVSRKASPPPLTTLRIPPITKSFRPSWTTR